MTSISATASFLATAMVSALLAGAAVAEPPLPAVDTSAARQVSTHTGEMGAEIEAVTVEDSLRFEPYQQLEDMFLRNDVVFVMRHGPTNWSKLDEKNVAPTDCENQRIMSEGGIENMRDLGTLMASNGVIPAQIVVSEWCRNQQTLEHLFEGFDRVDPAIAEAMPVETDPSLNLLLSLQGAKDVSALRDRISAWEGHPDRSGPLLLITHYTNIEELTQFRVFEGEALVLDPKRDNQVLGYVRLRSAAPDVGHFADALGSPLLEEEFALDMVERYYAAINAGDVQEVEMLLSDRWVGYGLSEGSPEFDTEGWLEEVAGYRAGLSDGGFDVEDVYVADDVVTVVGTIRGIHTGKMFGVPATGKEVAFGGIAVHRIVGGEIVETWQMADRFSLIKQLRGQN